MYMLTLELCIRIIYNFLLPFIHEQRYINKRKNHTRFIIWDNLNLIFKLVMGDSLRMKTIRFYLVLSC